MICFPERMSHLSKRGKKDDSFDSKERDYDLSVSEKDDETDDDVFISDLDHRRQQARLKNSKSISKIFNLKAAERTAATIESGIHFYIKIFCK